MIKMRFLFILALLFSGAITSVSAQSTVSQPSIGVERTVAQPFGATQNYILGPDDVLQIDALGRTDFSTRGRIAADGTLQLPFLGTFKVSGYTISQLRDVIAGALQKAGYFAHPIIQVEVASYASRYVTVLGNVVSPGLVPVDRAYHLSEILARVGGVREGGADYVILRSSGDSGRSLAIKDLATGDETLDPYVQPGDKIYSPSAPTFYIQGQVKAPGGYPLTPNMSLTMAIARGGGITDLGSTSNIKITRKSVEIRPKDLNVSVEPDDVINVGESWF
jgi:polysaccharide export outer membrane protein